MKFRKPSPKYHLSLPLTLLVAVLLAGCITLLALWCQPNALRTVVANLTAQPLLIVLNTLPIGLLLLAFTCLFRNVFYSGALVNVCVCLLSVANRIKLEVRDEPVFPRDFALLKEVGSAMNTYDISFPVGVFAVVLLSSLILAGLGLFVGCRPFSVAKLHKRESIASKRLHDWLLRILGAVSSFAVLTVLILTVYASNDLYNSFRVSNAYYIPSVFNELGFPYCFCHQFTTYPIDRPNGFQLTEAERWDTAETVSGLGKDVNVIMVMNEAFSDITDHPMFTYDETSDPLPNLHALQADPNTIASGHLVVPGFAGGTANTEFDVLTGMQTNALSATTTSAMRTLHRNLDSLFRVFSADGYHTSFFHPGNDWFYNRENVYRWFGAEETVFIDQMSNVESKGRWVTDAYLAGLIEAEFEEAMAQGQTLFHYTTTIQNHMSYTLDKYGADYQYSKLETSADLSDATRTMLEVYVEGARDADAMLGRLWNYFSLREEPVVLVYFGDHLPYLGDNQLGYTELGLTENETWSELLSYETPYIIWANSAAIEVLGDNISHLDMPGNELSAAFLGAAVLEVTGRGTETPWLAFLNELRRIVPVVQKQTYLLSDQTILHEEALVSSNPELEQRIRQWRQWSYYKLKHKTIHDF